ncbi:MAG: ElyC/SanA/YdcF family protein [Microcoleaceae cyanobacterium]
MSNNTVIYVPSYCLSKRDPSRLTDMSLQTAKRGLEMMSAGMADKIIFSTVHAIWEKEAKIKKDLAAKYGVRDDLVEIIPATTDTFDEAVKLNKIIANPDAKIIAVCQKYHAGRVTNTLSYFFKHITAEKVTTKIERQLDPSNLKSILITSTKLNFILWQWFFDLIAPLMMRRRMRKEK